MRVAPARAVGIVVPPWWIEWEPDAVSYLTHTPERCRQARLSLRYGI